MCSIDYDPPEFYTEADKTARKPHTCSECSRQIVPGEKYRSASGKWEGDFQTFKTCAHCFVGQKWLLETCRSFEHTGLFDQMVEHAREYAEVKWTLGRIAVGVRRAWALDGQMLPVPKACRRLLWLTYTKPRNQENPDADRPGSNKPPTFPSAACSGLRGFPRRHIDLLAQQVFRQTRQSFLCGHPGRIRAVCGWLHSDFLLFFAEPAFGIRFHDRPF